MSPTIIVQKLWNYDLRTNMHFTLKTSPMKREVLDEFVACYNPANRHDRKATWFDETHPHPRPLPEGEGVGLNGRWRVYGYDELIAREKPWGTHYKLKTYVKESREQFEFITDLTIRGKEALRAMNVRFAHAPYAETGRG